MHRSSHKTFYDRVNKKHLWQCSLILGFRWGRKIMVSFVISFKTLFETTYDWVSILAKYYELSVHIVTRKKCLKSILSEKKYFYSWYLCCDTFRQYFVYTEITNVILDTNMADNGICIWDLQVHQEYSIHPEECDIYFHFDCSSLRIAKFKLCLWKNLLRVSAFCLFHVK